MANLVIRIYFDPALPFPEKRTYYSDLARLFWHSDGRTEQKRLFSDTILIRVDTLEEADITALPMSWNYYVDTSQTNLGQGFISQSRASHKPCILFAMGDYKPHVPKDGVIVFGSSLYHSRINTHTHAAPAIFEDYIQGHHAGKVLLRDKQPIPHVGFCGQGKASSLAFTRMLMRNMQANIVNALGIAKYEAPPIIPHTRLRTKVLRKLLNDTRIDTNFIIHEHYWAGLDGGQLAADQRKLAKQRFVENIINTDYTVCVRGAANYSKRFYETLCCGRIPIFVNTDCVLPFEDVINWKQYCVWIEEDELDQIGDKVIVFHNTLSDTAFKDLQSACRQLWLDRLTQHGFMAHLGEFVGN